MLYPSSFIFIFLLKIIFTFAFVPIERFFHSSVLIDKKLYFSGGYINTNHKNEYTNELFYLDVSKPFNTTDSVSMSWNDLSYTNGPLKAEATACIGGKNNDIIFIFGGYPLNQPSIEVNAFDIRSKQQWMIKPNFTEVVPTNRTNISCAKFNDGSIAIFSGTSNNFNIDLAFLWIFNTLTLSWSINNATDRPSPRFGYNAINLPDKTILYIGGVNTLNQSDYMPMNNLPLYSIGSNTWTNTGTSGPTPPPRAFFSAVLTSDGRIIIFGGKNNDFNSTGDLWILNILTYQWSRGNISNPIPNLTLHAHTATLVDNYMIVAFGQFGNNNLSSRIFILDVSRNDSYKWVTEFVSNNTISNYVNSNTRLIIGVVFGSVISLVIIVIGIFITLKFIDKA